MKQPPTGLRACKLMLFVMLVCLVPGMLASWASGASLSLAVEITPQFQQKPVVLNELALTNGAGQVFSVTRLDFLVSEFSLQTAGGDWIEKTNWQELISLGERRSTFAVNNIPAGEYRKIRFFVGLLPEVNHGNSAQHGPRHPLNPVLNNLYWSWANGYVFFAIEGHWGAARAQSNAGVGGKTSGYSYHLGNDWMLTEIELPLPEQLKGDATVQLALDLEKFFDFEFTEANASTHSRKGDRFAIRLRGNLKRAFSVKGVRADRGAPVHKESSDNTVATVATLTPYRFTFPAQFPIPDLPRDNPLTEEGVALGRMLFFDKQLSLNQSQSCASCHDPAQAFTDSKRVSIGVDGVGGVRNSMPLFNLAWKKSFFWDGRAPSLRKQVLEPIQNPVEMHETLTNVTAKLAKSEIYLREFEKLFGTAEITPDRIALALEQFLLTQLSFDSKFDRVLEGKAELTDQEKRGFELFITEYDPRREQYGADCFHCHGGPLFLSQSFGNNGLDATFTDMGRYEFTKNDGDRGKFAVPSLRNVELTAPYMHDGRFKTLEDVVENYAAGVKRSPTLDPNIAKHPDGGVPLTDPDKKALVAFLKTLTDEKFKTARSATDRN